MKRILLVLSRYRLITHLLALTALLFALAIPPARAQRIGTLCEPGCVWWEEGWGCLDCENCCSDSNNPGWYRCDKVDSSFCS